MSETSLHPLADMPAGLQVTGFSQFAQEELMDTARH